MDKGVKRSKSNSHEHVYGCSRSRLQAEIPESRSVPRLWPEVPESRAGSRLSDPGSSFCRYPSDSRLWSEIPESRNTARLSDPGSASAISAGSLMAPKVESTSTLGANGLKIFDFIAHINFVLYSPPTKDPNPIGGPPITHHILYLLCLKLPLQPRLLLELQQHQLLLLLLLLPCPMTGVEILTAF